MARVRMRQPMELAAEALRTQLWPLPGLGVLAAIILGVLLPGWEKRIEEDLPGWISSYLIGGGPDAARTMLEAIAGSMITVTSLTFSLTVVTLQLASSQFSPRLLRTFAADRFVHVTLALFLATFTYALTVLRTVRTSNADQDAFVPALSVTVAFLLALASVIALVVFLAHLANEIQVEPMLQTVHSDASATLARLLPGEDATPDGAIVPDAPPDAMLLVARSSGFVAAIDHSLVLTAATRTDAVVLVDRLPGAYVVAGTPVGCAWPRDGGELEPDRAGVLAEGSISAISVGARRTSTQDIAFGLRQLTDVAAKALSPGINDPTTATYALGHTSALLCELAARDLGPVVLRDEHDAIRVVLARPDLADLLDLALAQPRRYGASDPFVMERVVQVLDEVAWCARTAEQRQAVLDQLAVVRETVDAQDFSPVEQGRLGSAADRVDEVLARPTASRPS